MTPAGALAGRRVLVVEDEMMVCWQLEDMLTDLGCTVVGPVGTVAAALRLIGEETFDAAVLDVNLDGEMSYPIADVLAARHSPFMFSTGYRRDRLLEAYRACPMLQKPFKGGQLGEMLQALLA